MRLVSKVKRASTTLSLTIETVSYFNIVNHREFLIFRIMEMKHKTIIGAGVLIAMFVFSQCTHKTTPVKSKVPEKVNAVKKSGVISLSLKNAENFDNFYQRFHKDSLFQISRVKFPLKGQQVRMTGASNWKKENWLMIKAKAGEIDRTLYNVKTLKKDDSYFEGIYCKNCVFTFEMEYKLINGKWFLVYLKEKDE